MSDEAKKNIKDIVEKLISQSEETDLLVLLQAKEEAKRLLKSEPKEAANLLHRLSLMIEKAETKTAPIQEENKDFFKSVGNVLRYLQDDCGKKIQKSKIYEDTSRGLLRKEKNGYRKVDVNRYGASLPNSTTADGKTADAQLRQKRKEEAEIRIKEAQAIREEKKNAIMDGQYVLRELVDQELAAKAVVFNVGIKSKLEAKVLDFITTVEGNPKRSRTLISLLEKILDEASNEFAQPIEFEILLNFKDENSNLGDNNEE